MHGFDGIQRGNHFRGEPIRRAEVEGSVAKLKNRKAAGKDEITGEMTKGGKCWECMMWVVNCWVELRVHMLIV